MIFYLCSNTLIALHHPQVTLLIKCGLQAFLTLVPSISLAVSRSPAALWPTVHLLTTRAPSFSLFGCPFYSNWVLCMEHFPPLFKLVNTSSPLKSQLSFFFPGTPLPNTGKQRSSLTSLLPRTSYLALLYTHHCLRLIPVSSLFFLAPELIQIPQHLTDPPWVTK